MAEEHFADRHTGQDNKLVSAIITTHNREPGMVLRAVNSVLNQTYIPESVSPQMRKKDTRL